MKKTVKNFMLTDKYHGHTIMVYGELWEEGYIDGVVITRAKFSKDGKRVMDASTTSEDILLNRPYTRTRYFNMGWAICSPDDKFDKSVGIELCKKRFRKSPLRTETGLFLTKDMVMALIRNEIRYIKIHWAKFAPKAENFFYCTDSSDSGTYSTSAELEPETFVPQDFEIEIEDASNVAHGIEKGSYVTVKNDDGKKVVGFVESVNGEDIYFSWFVSYSSNYCSFRYNFGTDGLHCYTKDARLSTEDEIKEAVSMIEKWTYFKWDRETEKLVRQRF